jgi:DNA-binding response OmpR family regulator
LTDEKYLERILIANDDLAIRELIELTLQQKGYEIFSAAEGKSAFWIAEKEKSDPVLLDVQ